MSETQDQPKPLDKIIHHLITALSIASQTRAPDAIRRGITNALLTAQMHDRERVARLEAWLAAEVPGPRAVGERLALVPMVGPTREEQPARIAEQLEAAAREAAGGGGQISSDPVRTNVRPFITAANVVRAAGNRRPATLAEAAEHARVAADCGHPWHVVVSNGADPMHTYCPGGCGATVQSSTIATPIDAATATALAHDVDAPCAHPETEEDVTGLPGAIMCSDCGAAVDAGSPTAPVDAAGIPHKSHYAVNGHPPVGCFHPFAMHHDLQGCAADRCPCDFSKATWPGDAEHERELINAVTREPDTMPDTAIMRQDDGDTREWVGNHTIDCMNRDCTGCA